jgi:hypothetical protein
MGILYYLQNLLCPNHIIGSKRRTLRLSASRYCLMKDGFSWRNPDGFILRCVDPIEAQALMNEMHGGSCGGHFVAKATVMRKISLWHGVNHNRWNDTQKSTLIPSMLYK